jgi:anti-sigma B factor antagonist
MGIKLLEKRRERGLLSIDMEGELTYLNCNFAKGEVRNLLTPEVEIVLLGLKGVPFMDSAGIWVIVSLLREMYERGGELALAELQPNVAKVLSITNLDQVLSIYPLREQAEHGILESKSLKGASD